MQKDSPSSGEKSLPSDALNVILEDQSGEELYFRVRQTTRINRIFETYAARKNVALDTIRFEFQSRRIMNYHKPIRSLRLKDYDKIFAIVQRPASPTDNSWIKIRDFCRSISGDTSDKHFKIKRNMPLSRLFQAFAAVKNRRVDSMRFIYQGGVVEGTWTPHDLDMVQGPIYNRIDAVPSNAIPKPRLLVPKAE